MPQFSPQGLSPSHHPAQLPAGPLHTDGTWSAGSSRYPDVLVRYTHARKWGKKHIKIWEPTTLVKFLGMQGAVASRYLLQRKKPVYISIKKQAQCESGSSYQVWLALKTVRLWLVLQDETLEAPNTQWQNHCLLITYRCQVSLFLSHLPACKI